MRTDECRLLNNVDTFFDNLFYAEEAQDQEESLYFDDVFDADSTSSENVEVSKSEQVIRNEIAGN